MNITQEQWKQTFDMINESSQILSVKTIHVMEDEETQLTVQKNIYKQNDEV